ncbi:dual specificity protein phosphatase family protein [Patescibacteria group bacterium]|nr:dual specificity protein phosphatase family protein [Patescibacteria group bacterium]MBU1956745.1 dual specificity protein phosphatase family protein [Patescibacteria group bacterium]
MAILTHSFLNSNKINVLRKNLNIECKEPYHKALLGYTGRGAPKNHPEYLYAIRNNKLFLNIVDVDDPSYISEVIINESLKFIDAALQTNKKCLVHCNLGESRSPSIGLLYLASKSLILIGSFVEAEQSYRLIYPAYNPKNGIRNFIQSNWSKYAGRGYILC